MNLSTGRQVRAFADKDPQGAMVNSAAISRDGRYVLAGQTHRAELWDIASGTMVRAFKGHHGFVNGAALLPNGKHGLSVGDEGHFFMWDLQTGLPVRDFSAQGGLLLELKAMAVTADGRYALTGGGGAQSLRLWDMQTGKEPVRFDGNRIGNSTVSPAVRALAISRDGRIAVTGGSDKILCVWELKTGKLLRKIAGSPSIIGAAALSPDGRFAVTGNNDQIELWDVSSGKELHEFASGLKHIYSIAFSPDGRFVLSGGMGDSLRLWDAGEWTKAGE